MSFLKNRLKAFTFAWKGLVTFIRQENSAKVHLTAAIAVVVAGFVLEVSPLEWMILSLTIGLVFAVEIINTAIEELVNLVHPEKGDRAGKIKDIAAAGVFITSIVAVVVACLIFVPKLI